MAVQAIPDGFTTVTPHMVVEGCADAIEFYKKAFGAEELGRMAMPDGKRLMHAMIRIGNSPVMMVDAMEEFGAKGPKGLGGTPISLNLYFEDAKAAMGTRRGGGLHGDDAAGGNVLGRPLRQARRSVRAFLGNLPARPRRQP